MSLKDRLGSNIKSDKDVEKKLLKSSDYDVIFERILEGKENIIFCCPIDVKTSCAMEFAENKIDKKERIVTIGNNLNIQRDEIIKFEPDRNSGQKDLINTALQIGASKILLENFEGVEAVDIFKKANAGISNIITAVKANRPDNVMLQIELNLYLSGVNIPETLMKKILCNLFSKVILLENFNGKCLIEKIYSVEADKNGDYVIKDVAMSKKDEPEIKGFDKNILNKKLSEVINIEPEKQTEEQKKIKTQKETKKTKNLKNILSKKIKRNKLID